MAMTQEQALAAALEIFSDRKKDISVERNRTIGYMTSDTKNTYYIWDDTRIAASSDRSWEHALAIAKSGNDDIWEATDSEVGEDA